ncbi:hypothetical protein EMCG_04715 [[Emmonsia] crescens]|uniref:Uncharacterized protein n=1 Tax=[Emmonsia] crescens TaxID=73230 RepID=A0A0G2IYI7_9EURO|nr:hypothetical protein EMCG_04715 [Emmonsia crescens UAMH 3008]
MIVSPQMLTAGLMKPTVFKEIDHGLQNQKHMIPSNMQLGVANILERTGMSSRRHYFMKETCSKLRNARKLRQLEHEKERRKLIEKRKRIKKIRMQSMYITSTAAPSGVLLFINAGCDATPLLSNDNKKIPEPDDSQEHQNQETRALENVIQNVVKCQHEVYEH